MGDGRLEIANLGVVQMIFTNLTADYGQPTVIYLQSGGLRSAVRKSNRQSLL